MYLLYCLWFCYLSQLSTLKISTYPSIRSFRLQDILSKSDALKTVQIDVKESILSHQIQWAFGGKLRELIITGNNLVHILPDAFQGCLYNEWRKNVVFKIYLLYHHRIKQC